MATSKTVGLVGYASSSDDSDDEQTKITETEGKRKRDNDSPEQKGADDKPNQEKR